PGPGKAHEELLGALEDVRFFNAADGYEHPQNSAEFISTIRMSVRHIRELLTLMRNKGQELYAAPGAIEMHLEREELERELKDRGFTVSPGILLDPTFGTGAVRKVMETASLAVFVLGAKYDEFMAEQIEVAQELGKPAVFWVQPGEGQKAMLDRLQAIRP